MPFIPNPFLEAELRASPAFNVAMHSIREHIAQEARDTAPVSTDPGDPTPGSFRDSIHVEGDNVVADDPVANIIEFGSEDTPVFATLRRAAEAVTR
jgi:hypothetical protein